MIPVSSPTPQFSRLMNVRIEQPGNGRMQPSQEFVRHIAKGLRPPKKVPGAEKGASSKIEVVPIPGWIQFRNGGDAEAIAQMVSLISPMVNRGLGNAASVLLTAVQTLISRAPEITVNARSDGKELAKGEFAKLRTQFNTP